MSSKNIVDRLYLIHPKFVDVSWSVQEKCHEGLGVTENNNEMRKKHTAYKGIFHFHASFLKTCVFLTLESTGTIPLLLILKAQVEV